MQKHVETAGFSVVTQYVGHGIGRIMHENPQVPNFVEHARPASTTSGWNRAWCWPSSRW